MKKSILWILMVLLGVTSFSKEKIVVYVPSSMTFLQEEVGQDFYDKTGVEVEIVGIKGIPARLKLEKRRPKADIVLGLSEINVIQAKKEGTIASYKPKTAGKIMKEEYMIDSEWYSTPFDFGSLAINANKDGFQKMPASFEDLKKLKGQLIVLDPNSFTGQEFMMWTVAVYGENWLKFWEELKPAMKTVAPGWSEGWAKFTTNEAPLMVGYATSDLYFDEKSSYKSFIPSEGGYIYVQGASIVAKKDIKDGAKLFMDYILEEKFQRAMAEKNYMLPVTDIKLGDEYSRIPTSAKLVKVKTSDLEKIEEYKKELIKLLKR
ncbi:thiamine ABC transporter substrate-binding protein [Fusobacteria bacterium ZRK30]|nr:thiamine ABC transporter substrate-binding protein [Fusobacteria bacterium ZRK30]